MRPLHWVIKSGDLRATVEFYSFVLGLKVLRHEEFNEGCEATCNGRWGGAWSKTMMGVSSETVDFCLEIIYNWGITEYSRGNAFVALRIGDPNGSLLTKAQEWHKASKSSRSAADEKEWTDPDGNLLVFTATSSLLFDCVCLRVTDLGKALDVYVEGFGGKVASTSAGRRAIVKFGNFDQTGVELIQAEVGEEVVQGDAQGRFATETEEGGANLLARRLGHTRVVHGPLQLPPHHERVVVVNDLDGNEYAFVEAKGYAVCILAGARDVDWKYREDFARSKRTKKQIEAEEAVSGT